jgi:hypothetical protein
MSGARRTNGARKAEALENRGSQTPQAVAGAVMCVVALFLVGVILTRTTPHAANDVPVGVSSITAPLAPPATVAVRDHVTATKKHSRKTPTSTVAPTTLPTTVPTTAPPPVFPVRTQTRVTRQPVVRTVVTAPPTTQPSGVVVPYNPPPPTTPGTVAVPIAPTSTPGG